jgi:hypothetical protein
MTVSSARHTDRSSSAAFAATLLARLSGAFAALAALLRPRGSGAPFSARLALVSATALLAALALAPAAHAAFGLHSFDVTFSGPEGEAESLAGAHPFSMTTSLQVNTETTGEGTFPEEQVKDIEVAQIPGFVGDQTAVPQCSSIDFLAPAPPGQSDATGCSNSTVIGFAHIEAAEGGPKLFQYAPLYNLTPPPGSVARLGFSVLESRVQILVGLDEEPPYRLVAHTRNISQVLEFFSADLTIWGVPGDNRHDPFRGTCLKGIDGGSSGICPGPDPKPFLTLPRACRGPLSTAYEMDSWQNPGPYLPGGAPDLADPRWVTGSALTHDEGANPQGMLGCGSLGFSSTITARPTSKAASSPSGLDFSLDLQDQGLKSPEGRANADVGKAVVTLPAGMSVNPSQAEGLAVCSEGDLARETSSSEPGAGCPGASKVGTVEVETPLLSKTVDGSLYVATPYENPEHSLIALYMVLQDRELGISIRLPLRVETDPSTGRITTVAEGLPELPFAHFRLHFREGARSPLATPSGCGSYAATALLYPFSGGAPVETSSAFEIISGPEAGPCPSGGTPPFHPALTAGTLNNAAGTYSPFDVHLSRTDSEQEITHFSIKLPPGVTGKLAGIPFCPESAIAAARSRERTPHGGAEELDRPSCPAASQIGHTLVGSGIGPSPVYVPGTVYLAGPYNGSNLSIVAITAAKAGPFDLGTVVIREGLKVDPVTAEVSVDAGTSDPIPHIIDGIPVDLKDIRVYVDRPEFVKNPTSCEPTSTASTVLGSGTDFASEADDRPVTVTSRFQAADCASLGFKPALTIRLKGPTRRAGLPALTAVVTPHAGDANIGRAVVTLPKSEFLEQGHIGNSCTRVQFNSGAGNGAGCPANSVLGHAVAITPLLGEPLEGPVFLRSNGGERQLPDLVAALHSKLIDIDLVGFIDSLHKKGSDVSQIRTTFASVPDQPVTKFTLKMFGGKKGLLVNSQNLCKGTHRAISNFVGQNGKRYRTKPAVKVSCKKRRNRKHAAQGKAKGKGNSRLAAALIRRADW